MKEFEEAQAVIADIRRRKQRDKAQDDKPNRDNRGSNRELEDNAALTFAEQHADDFRYIAQSGRWLRWAGSHWETETTLFAFD